MADELLKIDGNEHNITGALDAVSAELKNLRSKECDFSGGGSVHALCVVPLYYNPGTLSFEYGRLPNITISDLTVSMGDVEKLLALSYWKSKQYDWTSGDLDYMALNTEIGAADGDATWYVFKFEWSEGCISRISGPVIGAWSNRAALF